MAFLYPYSRKDAEQVLKAAFDDSTQRLRVDAAINIDANEVSIDAADGDNIAISDGVDTVEVNPDGSLNVNVTNEIQIELDAADGDNVAISDGVNTLEVNPDGSINVNVTDPISGNLVNYYNEVTAVASGVLTTIQTYTVAVANASLQLVDVSGTNIATYTVLLNGNPLIKKVTYFSGEFNEDFSFASGLGLVSGDVVTVTVLHNRPTVGDFNSRILVSEI